MSLHHLILGQAAMRIRIHIFGWTRTRTSISTGPSTSTSIRATRLVEILHKAKVERATTILVALKFGDRRVRIVHRIETDNTGAARTPTWFVLNLCLVDLANRGEQLDKVVIAR